MLTASYNVLRNICLHFMLLKRQIFQEFD